MSAITMRLRSLEKRLGPSSSPVVILYPGDPEPELLPGQHVIRVRFVKPGEQETHVA